jgi:hypothetical protein
MTLPITSCSRCRIGLSVFSALTLLSFAAAFFLFISDDFVVNGQVVPATDARFVVWRIGLTLAGMLFAWLSWLFFLRYREPHMEVA